MESVTEQLLLNELETARQSLDKAFACLIPAPKILSHPIQISGKATRQQPTIKFVTENGFIIERACEREESTLDSASGCHFIVHGPNGKERHVSVRFGGAAIKLIHESEGSDPLPVNSPFWLSCAERHLATYLWEKNDYPPAGLLTINQLSAENLRLAMKSI